MPTDLTGTPTTLGIGTYNVDNDAPSGLGFNAAMGQIDVLIQGTLKTPVGILTGEIPVWNGSTWVRSSTLRPAVSSLGSGSASAATALFGDSAWAGGMRLLWDSVDSAVALPAASITTPAIAGTYKHLVVKYQLRGDVASVSTDLLVQIGLSGGAVDTGANYNTQRTIIVGAVAPNDADNISTTSWVAGMMTGANADSATYGVGEFEIPGYTGQRAAFIGKSIAQVASSAATGANRLTLHGGIYKNTVGPVTALRFSATTGNIASGRISVYGVG